MGRWTARLQERRRGNECLRTPAPTMCQAFWVENVMDFSYRGSVFFPSKKILSKLHLKNFWKSGNITNDNTEKVSECFYFKPNCGKQWHAVINSGRRENTEYIQNDAREGLGRKGLRKRTESLQQNRILRLQDGWNLKARWQAIQQWGGENGIPPHTRPHLLSQIPMVIPP